MELSQLTRDALEALRKTANREHSNGKLKGYVSDIVIDAVTIIENDGKEFAWAVGESGTHIVFKLQGIPGRHLSAINTAYGASVVWYLWPEQFNTPYDRELSLVGSYDTLISMLRMRGWSV